MNGIPKATRDDNFIFANAAAVDAQDWGLTPMAEVILRVAGDRLGTADFVVHARGFPGLGQGMIAFGEPQRLWLNNISPGDTVVVEEFNPIELGQKSYLGAVEIAIEFASKTKATDAPYDQESLAKHFILLV